MCCAAGRVDVADHRGERRRLARAGRAGDEDEAAVLVGERGDAGRQPELVEGRHVARDHAEGERDRAALAEAVDAEARQARRRVREVELAGRSNAEPRGGSSARRRSRERPRAARLERRPSRRRRERAVVPEDRRLADLQVHVAGAGGDGVPSRRMEIHENLIGSRPEGALARPVLLMAHPSGADTARMAVQPLSVPADERPSEGRPLLGQFLVNRGRLNTEGPGAGARGAGAERPAARPGARRTRPDHDARPGRGARGATRARVRRPERGQARRGGGGAPPGKRRPRLQAFPVRVENGTVVVAVADPTNILAHDDLRLALGTDLQIVVADAIQLGRGDGPALPVDCGKADVGAVETFSSAAWRANDDSDDRVNLTTPRPRSSSSTR